MKNKLYLIGIGGTGARCVEAFVHLCGSGLLFSESGELDDSSEINLLLVDADKACGNLVRTQETVNAYNKAAEIGRMKYKKGEALYGTFYNKFHVLEDANPWTPVDTNKSLDDILEAGLLDSKEKNAYEALFTKEERSTKLDKGFRAHPSIGAAAFTLALKENDKPWNQVINDLRNGARLFVFGSVFGGTGAAGFPSIGKILHRVLTNTDDFNVVNVKNWKIGGALILPYFTFPVPNQEEQEKNGMQGKSEDFMVNTKAALAFYDKEKLIGYDHSPYDSVYFIGSNGNDRANYENYCIGAGEQKNKSHYVELYAAIAAFDFFNKKDDDLKPINMVAKNQEYGLTWEDLPLLGKTDNSDADDYMYLKENRNRVRNFIKFLHIYDSFIHSWIEECYSRKDDHSWIGSTKLEKDHGWYKDLIKKQGVTLNQNQEVFEKYDSLSKYCKISFNWWRDIANGKNYLVHTEFLGYANKDANRVLVDNDKKELKELTKDGIVGSLTSFKTDKNASYSALMQAIYSMCIDEEKKK